MTGNEKLEEAKRLYETANADQRYVLESLFPELKESEDLEEAANDYTHNQGLKQVCGRWESKEAVELQADNCLFTNAELESAFKAGANWQKEQFEKNRLEHCDNITEEQYNLETGFIDYYLDKYRRMPTFLDAIEYGMKKAKEGEL